MDTITAPTALAPMTLDHHDRDPETRLSILRAAALLFRRNGFDGTSMRAIGEVADVGHALLVRFFVTKHAVLDELLVMDLGGPIYAAERLAAEQRSASDRLCEYIMFDLLHLLTLPVNTVALYNDDVLAREEFAASRALRVRLRTARQKIIFEGISAGEFDRLHPPLADGMIDAVMMTAFSRDDDARYTDRLAFCNESVVMGLRVLGVQERQLRPRLDACSTRALRLLADWQALPRREVPSPVIAQERPCEY